MNDKTGTEEIIVLVLFFVREDHDNTLNAYVERSMSQ